MDIYRPGGPANLFIQRVSGETGRAGPSGQPWQLGQVVRALVLEGGRDQALLAINRQRYAARTPGELQTGQQLVLETVRLSPRLEFRMLGDPLRDRLVRQLPQLTRPYNWGALVEELARPRADGSARPGNEEARVLEQLRQLLWSHGPRHSELKETIARLVMQLKFVRVQAQPLPAAPSQPIPDRAEQASFTPLTWNQSEPSELVERIARQVRLLEQGLPQSKRPVSQQQLSGGRASPGWEASRELLRLLDRQDVERRPLTQEMTRSVYRVLQQVRRQPALPPQLSVQLDVMLARLARADSEGQRPESRPKSGPSQRLPGRAGAAPQSGSTASGVPSAAASQPAPGGGGPAALPESSTEAMSALIRLLHELRNSREQVSAELRGQLEGLLERLRSPSGQQLSSATGELVSTLQQLTGQPGTTLSVPQGAQLGVLSQLFGLHLEAELLLGRQREALASLKRSLLQLRQQGRTEAEEPLQRLELFQLCKTRLAEENVQFLPLPFAELEEGYLLAEQQKDALDQDPAATDTVRMSLSLRLSALGSLRLDMFYDTQGLQLRIAGEDQEKMYYLQQQTSELRKALQAVRLQGVTFADDAEPPARQLARRLFPDSASLLDARI